MKGPDGKYLFGLVKMGEKGQIVIPKEAREVFHLHPGDQLLLLGDSKQGMALVSPDMLKLFQHLPGGLFPGGAEEEPRKGNPGAENSVADAAEGAASEAATAVETETRGKQNQAQGTDTDGGGERDDGADTKL